MPSFDDMAAAHSSASRGIPGEIPAWRIQFVLDSFRQIIGAFQTLPSQSASSYSNRTQVKMIWASHSRPTDLRDHIRFAEIGLPGRSQVFLPNRYLPFQ